MKITFTHISIIFVLILSLIAGNVYQYRNPQVVEVPTGQTAIDSTAWVKRSAYATRGFIIDSLSAQNEQLAQRVRKSDDEIANYTAVTGKLRLKVDSLKNREPVRVDSFFTIKNGKCQVDLGVQDTAITYRQTFSDSLFTAKSRVWFRWPYLNNDIWLIQNRNIRLDVVNTLNDNHSRMLTYVTSPDFEDLRYQTYTQLQPKNELPKFWLGTGFGVIGTLATFLLLN